MAGGISHGTLNLRFMQNAQRAQNQANAAEQAAETKAASRDESQWEVSAEIKEAWGIGSSSDHSSQAAVHEASYLPFLFSSTDGPSDSVPKPPIKGRRQWDKRGREIIPEDVEASIAEIIEATPPSGRPSVTKKLKSISGSASSSSLPRGDKGPKKMPGKTARELIREDVVKVPLVKHEDSFASASKGFMKPAGVDAPADSARAAKHTALSEEGNSTGARGDPNKPLIKRERDDRAEQDGNEGKQRKKKKKRSE
ncbi:hypothetical protein EWM64_g3747 [Hericium alpestre]|uniref:Uncharacterized protein n=1 Tax=Hericium alpestre TaxID=135208 RepID=A0A4Z0A1B7_9AGAM|nr:hypothetical protein EWM64_g3747 [Hericium alpestre]